MRSVTLTLLVLSLASATTLGQRPAVPATPTGLIVGRLVVPGGGPPPAGVIVALGGGGMPTRRVIVDAQGRFMFSELPAGAYTLTTTKTGYIDGAYGQERPDGAGRSLALRDGERVTDLTIKMWRYATIAGTVTDDLGDPVQGARVQVLRRTLLAGRWQFVNSNIGANTDERGLYRITQLIPGDYAVVITSFLAAFPVGLMEAAVAARQSETGADVLRVATTNGTNGFFNDVTQGAAATTRVGDMLVQGSSSAIVNGTIRIYPTAWYPSARTLGESTIVTVGAGDHRDGIDLTLTRASTVRVSGHVTGAEGDVPFLALRLVPTTIDDVSAEITSSPALSFSISMTATDANGDFTFMAVPPGSYVIRAVTSPPRLPGAAPQATLLRNADGMTTALPSGPPAPPMVSHEPTQWTATPITVGDTAMTGVSVQLRPGIRVTGRVEFEGSTPRPTANELRTIRTQLDPADGRTIWYPTIYQAQVDADSSFYTIGVVAGRYVLRVEGLPKGWSVKSAMVGGTDIIDRPIALDGKDITGLVLTLTDQPSGLSGRVRDAQGQPDESAVVVVFPTDGDWTNVGSSPRRLRLARPNRTGAFVVGGLPPGDYYAVAISEASAGAWQSPEMLQRLARIATRTTVADRQTAAVSLSVQAIR